MSEVKIGEGQDFKVAFASSEKGPPFVEARWTRELHGFGTSPDVAFKDLLVKTIAHCNALLTAQTAKPKESSSNQILMSGPSDITAIITNERARDAYIQFSHGYPPDTRVRHWLQMIIESKVTPACAVRKLRLDAEALHSQVDKMLCAASADELEAFIVRRVSNYDEQNDKIHHWLHTFSSTSGPHSGSVAACRMTSFRVYGLGDVKYCDGVTKPWDGTVGGW